MFVFFRHLLSDQTDPFNRSPLTMDLVKPHDELREKIQAWLEEQRASRKSVETASSEETSGAAS